MILSLPQNIRGFFYLNIFLSAASINWQALLHTVLEVEIEYSNYM